MTVFTRAVCKLLVSTVGVALGINNCCQPTEVSSIGGNRSSLTKYYLGGGPFTAQLCERVKYDMHASGVCTLPDYFMRHTYLISAHCSSKNKAHYALNRPRAHNHVHRNSDYY